MLSGKQINFLFWEFKKIKSWIIGEIFKFLNPAGHKITAYFSLRINKIFWPLQINIMLKCLILILQRLAFLSTKHPRWLFSKVKINHYLKHKSNFCLIRSLVDFLILIIFGLQILAFPFFFIRWTFGCFFILTRPDDRFTRMPIYEK